uniref:Gustatory and odorant receptor 22 n=2 Tax=Lygus hesperus TaxID=30085 RepID=A0A0A9WZW0_LYGHE
MFNFFCSQFLSYSVTYLVVLIQFQGWMTYSYKSFPFAYTVFVAITQIVLTVWNWEHLMSALNKLSQSATYETILLSSLVLVQVPSFLVGIYSWFFEVPSIVKCYNMSAAIEKRILDLFSTSSITTRMMNFWTALFGLDLVISMVFGSFIIYGSFLYTHSFAILFMFNFTRSHLASLHSCYVFTFSRDLARKLREIMIKNEEFQHHKLKICHNLWMEIWSVSQGHASSLAITLLVQIMSNLLFFITSSYGMIVLIKVGDIQQIIELIPYFFFAIFNVVLICESAQHAQDEVGIARSSAFLSLCVNISLQIIFNQTSFFFTARGYFPAYFDGYGQTFHESRIHRRGQ